MPPFSQTPNPNPMPPLPQTFPAWHRAYLYEIEQALQVGCRRRAATQLGLDTARGSHGPSNPPLTTLPERPCRRPTEKTAETAALDCPTGYACFLSLGGIVPPAQLSFVILLPSALLWLP